MDFARSSGIYYTSKHFGTFSFQRHASLAIDWVALDSDMAAFNAARSFLPCLPLRDERGASEPNHATKLIS